MSSDEDQLRAVNDEIEQLTGERYHQYTTQPKPGERKLVFSDGLTERTYLMGLARSVEWLVLMRKPVPCDNTVMHGPHAWIKFNQPPPLGGAGTGRRVGCRGVR